MQERGWIEPIVERVVGQVLETHAVQQRTEIVRLVMEQLAAEPNLDGPDSAESAPAEITNGAASSPNANDLARAVAEIQMGSSQREILRALLDTSVRYASRVALFVVKGSHATGWQARGFTNCEAVKDFALDGSASAIARAIAERVLVSAGPTEMDSRFSRELGTPASAEGRILPLILKDKVAALLYADSGTDASGMLDTGSLELLVLSTSAWLEVNSLRKQAHTSAVHANSHSLPVAEAALQAAPMRAAPAYHDPFASHAPGYAMAAAAAAGEVSPPDVDSGVAAPIADPVSPIFADTMVAETTIAETTIAETMAAADQIAVSGLHSAAARSVALYPAALPSVAHEMEPALIESAPITLGNIETSPVTPPFPPIAPEHQEIHRKAERFARLLVDEIKLYNQAKVADGRRNKDLYDRLQEAIEKSRAMYLKRYGDTAAASANYFQREIIRSLAEDDLSVMGANFRQ